MVKLYNLYVQVIALMLLPFAKLNLVNEAFGEEMGFSRKRYITVLGVKVIQFLQVYKMVTLTEGEYVDCEVKLPLCPWKPCHG